MLLPPARAPGPPARTNRGKLIRGSAFCTEPADVLGPSGTLRGFCPVRALALGTHSTLLRLVRACRYGVKQIRRSMRAKSSLFHRSLVGDHDGWDRRRYHQILACPSGTAALLRPSCQGPSGPDAGSFGSGHPDPHTILRLGGRKRPLLAGGLFSGQGPHKGFLNAKI